MPELPEVETAARDLDAQLRGARLAEVEKLDWPRMVETPDAEAFRAALVGRRIERVYRRAKWLLAELDAGLTLAVHLRMSGSLVVYGPEAVADSHVHWVQGLEDGRRLFFRDVRKFGRVRLLTPEGLAALDAAHGPEPLDASFTPAVLGELLASRATKIKPLLLDQAVVAGLGNIYVDEALWLSEVHPLRPARGLKRAEVTALHGAIREVLEASIARKGSTLRDYRTGFGESGENQRYFNAYNRTDEPCPRCATPIVRTVVGQRGTHFCPRCQKI